MYRRPQILINQLSYSIPETAVQFEGVTLSLEQRRYGIVGDNGVGKTTLLKLIAHQIQPQQGSIQHQGIILYCPQNYTPHSPNETISETLDIAKKLEALKRIQQNHFTENDYDIIGDDWTIESQIQQLLRDFDCEDIALNRTFLSLSGGQQTKCLLLKSLLSKADFILWDEPTNNLDIDTREKLYAWTNQTNQGLIIVSHDRMLLNQMDEIIEITTKDIRRYSGNYDFYQKQKNIQQETLQQELLEAKQKIKHAERSIQQTQEKHEQRKKKGNALRRQGKLDKLTANSMKGRSEKTQSRNTTQADQMIQKAEETLMLAKSKIEIKESIHADLTATQVPNGKTVIEIEDLYFAYLEHKPLFENFSLSIQGPERISLSGKNGTGKTTLIKLIFGELQPDRGEIKKGVQSICYLDQQVDFLDPTLTLIENFEHLNPDINTQDAYFALASFNFRNTDTKKRVLHLSGGERIRAGLAISLLSKTPPQLIILDEPTNHLDIRSIEAIENALNAYQGAMIVISHDQEFLKDIHIQREIKL